MFATPIAARLLVATLAGIACGLFLPVPGWLAPTLAVMVFVSACFVLHCASLWFALAFASVVAVAPALAFAAGLSSRTPALESLRQSLDGFASHPQLVLIFLVVPFIVGALLHLVLLRALSGHVQS